LRLLHQNLALVAYSYC